MRRRRLCVRLTVFKEPPHKSRLMVRGIIEGIEINVALAQTFSNSRTPHSFVRLRNPMGKDAIISFVRIAYPRSPQQWLRTWQKLCSVARATLSRVKGCAFARQPIIPFPFKSRRKMMLQCQQEEVFPHHRLRTFSQI